MRNILIALLGIIIIGGGIYTITKKETYAPEEDSAMVNMDLKTNPYTVDEVAVHNNAESCWSIVNGNVYDLTSWIGKHPGGEKAILGLCGIDGTEAFTAQHGGKEKPETTLAGFKIGVIEEKMMEGGAAGTMLEGSELDVTPEEAAAI